MSKQQKNKEEVEYLKQINEERKRINKQLDQELIKLINHNENLSDYRLWVSEKCDIFIQPKFAIEKIVKNLEEEGFAKDIVYVIVKHRSGKEE